MQLRDATRLILDSEAPADWIKLADSYISSFNKLSESFILPSAHAMLAPVINAFYDNDAAFGEYIRAIRDQLPPGHQRDELHATYRTINGRSVQQVRRARLARALLVVEAAIGRRLDPDERVRVSTKLEQHWGKRRLDYLKEARSKTLKGRVSADERSDLVHTFWDTIDAEITRGDLPMFKF